MPKQRLLPAILLLAVAVPALFLALRERRPALEADSKDDSRAREIERMRQTALAAQEQSIFFSEEVVRLQKENAALRAAKAGGEGSESGAAEARLVAIDATLQSIQKALVELSRQQADQGTSAQTGRVELVRMLTELKASGAKSTDPSGAIAALEAKIDALAKAAAEADGRTAKSLEDALKLTAAIAAEQVEQKKVDEARASGLASEISSFRETIAATAKEIASLREQLASSSATAAAGSTKSATQGDSGSASEAAKGDGSARRDPPPDAGGKLKTDRVGEGPGGEEQKTDARSGSKRPPLATEVRAADANRGVVILGKGEKHGIQQGDTFDVTRLGRAIGKVKIVRLWEDYCGAEIVDVEDGEMILSGDVARNYIERRDAPRGSGDGSRKADDGQKADGAQGKDGETDASEDPVIIEKKERRPPPPPGGSS